MDANPFFPSHPTALFCPFLVQGHGQVLRSCLYQLRHHSKAQAGWLKQQMFTSSHVCRLEIHGQGVSKFGFWGELSSWLDRGHSSVAEWKGKARVPLPLLVRSPVLSDQGPTLMASSNLSTSLMAPSPSTAMLGVPASAYEFGGTQFSP